MFLSVHLLLPGQGSEPFLQPLQGIRDQIEVEIPSSALHLRAGELIFDCDKAQQNRNSGGGRPLRPGQVRPQRRPDPHQINRRRQHHAIERRLDQRAGIFPGQHLVDDVAQAFIEKQVDVRGIFGGAIDAAAAADRLFEFGLADQLADALTEIVGVLIAIGRAASAVT